MTDKLYPQGIFSKRREGESLEEYKARLRKERKQVKDMSDEEFVAALNNVLEGLDEHN